MAEKKKKRPISRKFWNYLKFLPNPVRAEIIRSQFEVDYDLPAHITFKIAETENEIKEALQIVHDSFVDLNYIDPNDAKMRFSKFHALPTTVIVVAKWQDEVIGTMTIIPDSAFGVPCDQTWDLSRFRKNGKLLAEISSLAIKKNFRLRRGKLLLPLCRYILEFSWKYLQVDYLIIATTVEVEAFYTDIILFKKTTASNGQAHNLVKGNPSACCYLELGEPLIKRHKRVFGWRKQSKNIYHLFFEAQFSNMIFPDPQACVQAYTLKKNVAQGKILEQHSSLSASFSESDMVILKNLDVANTLPSIFTESHAKVIRDPGSPRLETRFFGWVFFGNRFQPTKCQILDVSKAGFHINLKNTDQVPAIGDSVFLILEFQGRPIQCRAKVMWDKHDSRLGCQITEASRDWLTFIQHLSQEILPTDNVIKLSPRKPA